VNIIKALAKDWLPPPILRLARKILFREKQIHFDGEFASWEEACARCTGYDVPQILAQVLDATLKVKRGEAVYERDSVLFDHIEYAWSILAGLMWAAARNSGRLNVLDFGGSLGSSYFQNKKFLQTLKEVHWNVVEQRHFVEAGQSKIQDGRLRFYKTIEECLNENRPNVILLSGVLQCLKDPEQLLDEVAGLGIDHILIDRTSFTADGAKKRLFVQHVPKSIYKASYPIWLLNESDFIGRITSRGYELIESFDAIDKLDDRGIWKGFLFCKTHGHAG
jgi:putative methyltransferase (TIGR04325 family)